jgi:phage shock protein PspC (stress-responsive transcriptional regulator)
MAEETEEKAERVSSKPVKSSPKTKQESPKRLFRSRTDRMIGGVCGGVAQYFGLDPVLIRVVWALAFFIGGSGFVAYIVAWIVVPENPEAESNAEKKKTKSDSTMIWGLVLIAIGAILLFQRNDWFDFYPHWGPWWFGDFDAGVILPVILILVGVVYLVTVSKNANDAEKVQKSSGGSTMEKKLTRSVSDKMIAGVCGGVAKYFNVDPSIVRIVWAVATVAAPFLGVVLYIVMLVVVPEETVIQSTAGPKTSTTKTKAK